METVDPVDSGSSRSVTDDEGGFTSDSDDFPDVGTAFVDSPRGSPPQKVPTLKLGALPQRGPQTVVPLSVRSGDIGSTSIAVDLLSNAFRLKKETIRQAREWGYNVEQIVGAAFSSALDIAKRNLRYYVVSEVALEEITENCPHHIAVGIEGSSFTLGAVEDMLRKNRESQQTLTNHRETLTCYENRISKLEKELQRNTEALHITESQNRQLRHDLETLRQAMAHQQQMPSLMSASLVSPRLMATGGSPNQLRSPSAMARLQNLIAENQQLVTDLERLSGPDAWCERTQEGASRSSRRLDLPTSSSS
ncbi:hypothetical protein BSKO_08663 [Bryopsis sp. KO-2023]|nr:hypothetical protein BSKO_08663 [Bryopsis sp. KO-2023]